MNKNNNKWLIMISECYNNAENNAENNAKDFPVSETVPLRLEDWLLLAISLDTNFKS